MGQIASQSELKNILSVSQESLISYTLQRKLGALASISMTIGSMIGTGIFILPKSVLMITGSVGMSLLIWTLSGLVSMLGALCYIEFGTTFPKSGGDYTYLRMCYGDIFAFLYMWVTVLVLSPVTKAIGALTFANYILAPIFLNCTAPPNAVRLIAALVLCLLTFINCRNVQWATHVQNVFTSAKVIALLIIIIAGISHICIGNTHNFDNAFQGTTTEPGYIALSFYSGLYCYSGWNFLTFVNEEVIDPYKNIPRTILISLPLVTVIYILANVAYFAVLIPDEILTSNAVAVTFGEKMLGVMSWIMPFSVALSTFGALNGSIFGSARIHFVGSREGHLPNFLSMINLDSLTPTPSIVFVGVLSLVYLSTTEIYVLINYISFVDALFVALSAGGMIWLRFKQPDLVRPIKMNICLLIAYLTVCIFLVTFPLYVSLWETGMGLLITLTGVPVYITTVYWKNKPILFDKGIEKATTLIQKVLLSVPEEKCS